jgi:Sulfocyanin (SoxE) domain
MKLMSSSSPPHPSRRAQRYQARRARARRRVIVAVGAGLATIAVVAVVVVARRGDGTTPIPFAGSTVEVTLGDFSISGNLTAPAGRIRLHATNAGGLRHNVGVRGGRISGDVMPGGDTIVDLGELAPGRYQLYCDVVGHVDRGMVAEMVVTEPAPSVNSTTVSTS